MTMYYYTFRSMTSAMNASDKLRRWMVGVNPVRTPEHLRKRGCGYCIPVPEETYLKVMDVLRPGDYEKLYCFRKGEWREITP